MCSREHEWSALTLFWILTCNEPVVSRNLCVFEWDAISFSLSAYDETLTRRSWLFLVITNPRMSFGKKSRSVTWVPGRTCLLANGLLISLHHCLLSTSKRICVCVNWAKCVCVCWSWLVLEEIPLLLCKAWDYNGSSVSVSAHADVVPVRIYTLEYQEGFRGKFRCTNRCCENNPDKWASFLLQITAGLSVLWNTIQGTQGMDTNESVGSPDEGNRKCVL